MPLSLKAFGELLRGLPEGASDEQVNAAAAEAEKGTPLQHIWDWMNRPLVGGKDSPVLAHEHTPEESGLRRGAEDLGASLTSPLNIALTATGVGAAKAAKAGAFGISNAARAVEAGLQAPLVAEGVGRVVEGETPGEKLAGGVEAGLGAYGMRSATKHAFEPTAVRDAYMAERGLTHKPNSAELNVERSKSIADAYEAMPHDPNNPAVAKSYAALGAETEGQFKFLKDRAGVHIEPWMESGQPYANSREMVEDIRKNNHLWYYPTDQGFGTNPDSIAADHPMLRDTAEGPVNDQFRAVHDYFGHATEGHQFGPKGEEKAWGEHSQMFSPEAKPAMTTETRGQNSWVNFGKHLRDETGAVPQKGAPGYVPPQERPFAPQKAGLLPAEFSSAPQREILPQGDELARGIASSTSRTGAGLPSGTGAASLEELSPELISQIKQLHDENGGATYNLSAKRSLVGEPYYAISAFPDRTLVLDHAPSEQDFANYVHKNLDLLQKPENSIGTWFNPEDQKHYLDVSITEPDRAKALALGAQHKQQAIFDLKNLDTIPVPKEGVQEKPAFNNNEQPTKPNIPEYSPAFNKAYPDAVYSPEEKASLWQHVQRINEGTTEPKPNIPGGSTALAVAAPAASSQIDDSDPNDPNRELKHYGKVALDLLGVAGFGAAIRKTELSPQKAAATKGAAYLLMGQKKGDWAKRMVAEGVAREELPKIRAASEKILSAQLAKAEGQMPNTKRLMEHFETGKADMGWYDEVSHELKELFGKDADLMAKLLAATSVNSTVKSNTTLALKAYRYIKEGRDIATLPSGTGEGFLPAVTKNLVRIANGEPIEGRKIDNFAKAIIGAPDAVVVDRWMLRAFGFNSNAATPHEYDVIEHVVKELAKEKGVTPRQMQASIWFSVKQAAEAGTGRPASPPYGKILREKLAQQKLAF